MSEKKLSTKYLRDIVVMAIQGDKDALVELCAEKLTSIYYTIVKVMRNRDIAEDILQEVLIKVYTNIGNLKSPEAFNVWIYRIVLNECKRFFRYSSRKTKQDIPMDEKFEFMLEDHKSVKPEQHVLVHERNQAIKEAIDSLPENYKCTIIFFYYEEMSYKEISQVMGISEGIVANNLVRARKSIKKYLAKHTNLDRNDIKVLSAAPMFVQAMKADINTLFPNSVKDTWVNDKIQSAMQSAKDNIANAQSFNNPLTNIEGAVKTTTAGVSKVTFGLVALAAVVLSSGIIMNTAKSNGQEYLQDPVSSSPLSYEEVETAPQLATLQEIAGGDLEIEAAEEEIVALPSEEVAPIEEEAIQPIEVVDSKMNLSGKVSFKSAEGYIKGESQNYLDGSSIDVYSTDGALVASTILNGNTFLIEGLEVTEPQKYMFSMTLANGTPVDIAAYKEILLEPGKNESVNLYIEKTGAPQGIITIIGTLNADGVTYQNIQELRVDIEQDLFPIEVWWEVTSCCGNNIYTAEHVIGSSELASINGQAGDETYNVRCVLIDVAGNKTVLGEMFRMII